MSTWHEWHVEAEEYRELDDERVLALFHFTARGEASGLEVREVWTRGASLFHLREGKVARLVQYLDRTRGLAELGIDADAGRSPAGD